MKGQNINTGKESLSQTIYGSFRDAATSYPGRVALMYKNDENKYVGITYRELENRVRRVAASLQNLGINTGDRVAIFSSNRSEWAIADLAVLKLGGIVVPIYQTLPAATVSAIMSDSGSKLMFVENAALLAIIDQVRGTLPSLQKLVLFDARGIGERKDLLRFTDLAGNGKATGEENRSDDHSPVSSEDVATIVYTSGTTGEPKGAMLSHSNITYDACAAMTRFHISSQDVILSYLPLCHMFERTCGYYTFLFAGGRIAYARDMTTIVEDVQAIRPTILIAVPRIIEKVHQAVEKQILKSSLIRRQLVFAAVRALNRYANLRYSNQRIPISLRIKRFFYDKAVASKFRKIAGGNLRLLVSGGAPLDRRIAKTLLVLGFNILEGYGLTETSPVVCCSSLEDNRLGTVGKPLEGVEVKIGANDEILVRGPNLMRGYFNKPRETAEAIDEQGWFHTGDQGRLDRSGNLIITGRIKELIVTSYGKNVPPVPIESELMSRRYIEQAVLHGDKRKCIIALIVPAREALEGYAKERAITADDYADLLRKEQIKQLIAVEINRVNANLPGYAQVKAFALLSESFSVGNQLLTPTLKFRRGKIFDRYRHEIHTLYESIDHVTFQEGR